MEDLKEALIKKALGFDTDEVVEEYSTDSEGNTFLSKRKVTKKHNPPDLAALKVLMEQEGSMTLENMTDAELEREKQRLLQLLKEKEKKDEDGNL